MKLLTGDITKIETDAIVNAASPDLRRSPGICDAIFAAADTRALTAACKKLRRCPVGTAVVTPSFGLPCKYIIHVALGEWMGDLRTGKRLMEACYIADLLLGWQDEGRARPAWIYRLFARVFGEQAKK